MLKTIIGRLTVWSFHCADFEIGEIELGKNKKDFWLWYIWAVYKKNWKQFPSMKLTINRHWKINLWPQVETNSFSSLSVSGAVCLFQVGDDWPSLSGFKKRSLLNKCVSV